MKLKHLALLVATSVLVAGPALAVERVYGGGQLTNTIVSPTAPGGCTTFDQDFPAGIIHPDTGCPTGDGDWLGRKTYFIIEDNGGAGALPQIIEGQQQSALFNAFPCENTSNYDSLGAIPGCVVEITTDTVFDTAVPGFVNAISNVATVPGEPNHPGWKVEWGPLFNENQLDEGRGQFCNAYCDNDVSQAAASRDCTAQEITRMDGYCAGGPLDLTQGAWDESSGTITVINPVDTGPWYFTGDMSSYVVPGPYRYFALGNPGDPLWNVVYGLYSQGSATAPYAVPLAPIGALALAGSLAYMGMASMRRKNK